MFHLSLFSQKRERIPRWRWWKAKNELMTLLDSLFDFEPFHPIPSTIFYLEMTSNPNYLGQGDHFPHLLASQISSSNEIPTRQRSTSMTKIKIRIRPLTIRFTEAGVNDLNIQVKARIDSKHAIAQQDVSKRDSKGKGKAKAVETDVPPQDQDDELSQLLDDLDDSVRALKAKVRRNPHRKRSSTEPYET